MVSSIVPIELKTLVIQQAKKVAALGLMPMTQGNHKPIAPVFVSMALDVGGEVPVMPFEISGSEEFAHHMLEWMGDKKAVIWANHGLLTIGETLQKAVHCTVMVESAAKIYSLALQIGGQVFPVPVPLRALLSA